MADNFDLRQFLTENKLTKNAQLLKEARVEGFDVNKKAFEVTFIDKYGGRDFRILNAETPEQAEEVFTNIFVNNPDQVQSIKSIEPYQVPAPKPQAQSQPGLEGVNYGSIEIDGVDSEDYPDFVDAYVTYAEFEDGTALSEPELYQLTDELYQSGELADMAAETLYEGKKEVEEGIHDRDVLSRPLSNPAIEPLDRSPEELGKDADSRSENILRMTYRNQINDPNISDEELRYILSGKGVKGFGGTPNAINNILASRSRMEEAKSYKVSKNSKEAQHLKKGDIIGSGDEVVSVSAGAKTPKGKVEVTIKTKDGKTKTSTWGKYTKVGVKEKETETVKENTMTQREKYLTRLVENALGIPRENHQNADPAVPNDSTDMAIGMMKNGLPEGDEMANETVIPEYSSIDELMKSIDHGTNKVAEEHKIAEMKKIAKLLREKAQNLEESEHAAHINPKDIKKLNDEAIKLDKAAAKFQAAYEKTYNKKEKSSSAPKAEKVEALQEGFDLRNFLVENKLTTNSRNIEESAE